MTEDIAELAAQYLDRVNDNVMIDQGLLLERLGKHSNIIRDVYYQTSNELWKKAQITWGDAVREKRRLIDQATQAGTTTNDYIRDQLGKGDEEFLSGFLKNFVALHSQIGKVNNTLRELMERHPLFRQEGDLQMLDRHGALLAEEKIIGDLFRLNPESFLTKSAATPGTEAAENTGAPETKPEQAQQSHVSALQATGTDGMGSDGKHHIVSILSKPRKTTSILSGEGPGRLIEFSPGNNPFGKGSGRH